MRAAANHRASPASTSGAAPSKCGLGLGRSPLASSRLGAPSALNTRVVEADTSTSTSSTASFALAPATPPLVGPGPGLSPAAFATAFGQALVDAPAPVPAGRIEGSLPQWLRGSYVRNGPANPGAPHLDHLFDGHALIARVALGPAGSGVAPDPTAEAEHRSSDRASWQRRRLRTAARAAYESRGSVPAFREFGTPLPRGAAASAAGVPGWLPARDAVGAAALTLQGLLGTAQAVTDNASVSVVDGGPLRAAGAGAEPNAANAAGFAASAPPPRVCLALSETIGAAYSVDLSRDLDTGPPMFASPTAPRGQTSDVGGVGAVPGTLTTAHPRDPWGDGSGADGDPAEDSGGDTVNLSVDAVAGTTIWRAPRGLAPRRRRVGPTLPHRRPAAPSWIHSFPCTRRWAVVLQVREREIERQRERERERERETDRERGRGRERQSDREREGDGIPRPSPPAPRRVPSTSTSPTSPSEATRPTPADTPFSTGNRATRPS